jgi:DnaJ-class molecular chaperone
MTQIQCSECAGSGKIPTGEHFVSIEMAIDAGDRSLAGQSMGVEWGPCLKCHGDGWIEED